MVKTFQDLLVWEKGHNLVLEVYKMTKFFPREEQFGLTSQIRRSCISICANIAEGYRKSSNDFCRYLDIAQGSLEETKYHLILSRDLGYLKIDQYKQMFDCTEEVGKMLNGLKQKIRG